MLWTRSGVPKYRGWKPDRKNATRGVRFRKGGFSTISPARRGRKTSWTTMRPHSTGQAHAGDIGVERTAGGTVTGDTGSAPEDLYDASFGSRALERGRPY
jgi:hypothetical protein